MSFALKNLFLPVIAFFVLSAVPLIGNFVMSGFVSLMGCTVNEADVHPCSPLGSDLADVAYGYAVDIFLAGAENPLLAGWALERFVISPIGIVWLVAVGVLLVVKQRMHRQIDRMTASTNS